MHASSKINLSSPPCGPAYRPANSSNRQGPATIFLDPHSHSLHATVCVTCIVLQAPYSPSPIIHSVQSTQFTDAVDEPGHSQASPMAATAERWALSFSQHRRRMSIGRAPLKVFNKKELHRPQFTMSTCSISRNLDDGAKCIQAHTKILRIYETVI